MQEVKRKKPRSYETDLDVVQYFGRNSWGNHAALTAKESRELVNWDIFTGNGSEYLSSRHGSAFLKKASAPTKRGSTSVLNAVTWDVGAEEYLITQEGTSFYFQALLTTGDPTVIATPDSSTFAVSASTQADMFVSGDKLYVFHSGGNKIIDWTGTTFVGYDMGMTYPYIDSITTPNSGVISGSYTMGLEKVYRVTGIDRIASTPNRKVASTLVLAEASSLASQSITLTVQADELDDDDLWTHIRVWRSKNKNSDYTDPLQPLDPQGNDDELYEEALITKAEIGNATLAAIATGSTLPPGNAGTQAGKPAGIYTIEVNNLDAVFFNLLGIDRIELLPLPAASTGCFHGNRIYVSAVNDSTLDDQSRSNIYYSNYAGTKYAAQYDPLQFVVTGRDGQQMMKLISFEKDLIGIKEAKTGRLPGGNVDLEYETLDFRIGISSGNLAAYIPAIGIVAVTNDHADFRILGYDLKWTHVLNQMDISLPIRNETAALTAADVSFGYINGKLMINDGAGTFYVLHDKESRGWTTYDFPQAVTERLFIFANGSRAAIVSKSTHLVEIELDTTDEDVNTADDTTDNAITSSETTWRFQSQDGRDNLEGQYLAVAASLSAPLVGIPYVNGLPWQSAVTEVETAFVPDPAIFGALDELKDAEYRLYLEPVTVGIMAWCRMRGNFLHYKLTTTAPAIIRSKRLSCVIDEDGMAFGEFDPFQRVLYANKLPDWNSPPVILFNFDDDGVTLYDQSGQAHNHTWAALGTRTHVASLPPGGGEYAVGATGSGWYRTGYGAMDYIGDDSGANSADTVYRWTGSFPSLSATVYVQGGSASGISDPYWQFKVNTDGSLQFELLTSTLAYKWKTAAATIVAGATVYTILFFLTSGGTAGQFYVAVRTASETTAKTTTRSALP